MILLHQRKPPVWLLVAIPIFMFVVTIATHHEQAAQVVSHSKNFTTAVVHKISETAQSYQHKQPEEIPSTIIREGDHDEYLAICLYVRDQAQDLVEWFQHHYFNIGVKRFYVMDDASNPPISHFKDRFGIPEEAIDFIYFGDRKAPQSTQYALNDHCALVAGVNNTWLAFIDADEFLDTPSGAPATEEILREIEATRPDAGALGVNWQMHTSAHQLFHVESVRRTFLECIVDSEESGNRHIKSIVRQDAYVSSINPHKFNLKPGLITIGEHGDLVEHDYYRSPITRDRIGLHHYMFKSYEDFNDKLSRSGYLKNWELWNHIEYQIPHEACAQMLKYFPKTVNQAGSWKRHLPRLF